MKKFYILILVILAVLAGLFFFFKDKQTADITDDEPYACTMDALICPDGSGVGRSGPKCEFQACQNQESFTGKLSQQGADFFLIVAAPENSGQEVSYSMPLKFSRISNVLGTLVNKTVKVKGAFTTGSTLEVDMIEETTPEVATTGIVGVGETKYINGVRITLNKILSDSRCPADATCIQAGNIVVNVTLKSNTDQETLNMADNDAPRGFDTWKVSLVSSSPFPLASKPVPYTNYKVTFKVEKL
ncbi:MAG: hypothetical protein WCT44_02035 [Candidatus Paceibacterota bacterium]